MTEAMNNWSKCFGNSDNIWALDYIFEAIIDNIDTLWSVVTVLFFSELYEIEIQTFVREEITFFQNHILLDSFLIFCLLKDGFT